MNRAVRACLETVHDEISAMIADTDQSAHHRARVYLPEDQRALTLLADARAGIDAMEQVQRYIVLVMGEYSGPVQL